MYSVEVKDSSGRVLESWEYEKYSEALRTADRRLQEYTKDYSGHYDPVYTIALVEDGEVLFSQTTKEDLSWMFN